MKAYGRIIDHDLVFAPEPLYVNGIPIDINDEESYNLAGWFIIELKSRPINSRFSYKQSWSFVDNKCCLSWLVVDTKEFNPRGNRKMNYESASNVHWNGEIMTVDEANKRFLEYLAERDTENADALSIKIKEAKDEVRRKIPDVD